MNQNTVEQCNAQIVATWFVTIFSVEFSVQYNLKITLSYLFYTNENCFVLSCLITAMLTIGDKAIALIDHLKNPWSMAMRC